jgi:carboxypeptidase T
MKAILFLVAFLLGFSLIKADEDPHELIELSREFKLATHNVAGKTPEELLSKSCWDYRVDEEGYIYVTGFSTDRQTLLDKGFKIVSEKVGYPLSAAPPEGYHTPDQLYSEFLNIQNQFPNLAQLIDITQTYGAPLSHEGRRVYTLKISDNVGIDEVEPNYLIISNHHARELITPELALNTSLHLVKNYGVDPDITKLVNDNQIYIMWTINPDGLEYVWSTDNMWRKNRAQNSATVYGVDLNRNYPIGWDFSCSGSTVPSSETYRGEYAASEPEVQTMMIFQAERRFAKVFDFHSYAREVRIIYGDCASLPTTVDNYFKSIAVEIAAYMRYVQARSCCMAGNIHFAYHDQGSLPFLVETAAEFQPNRADMEAELARVLPGTLYFLTLPIPIQGRTFDAATNYPVEATLRVDGLNFQLEETNRSNPKNGLFHMWLPDGNWNVTMTATGYQQQSVVLSPSPNPYTIYMHRN